MSLTQIMEDFFKGPNEAPYGKDASKKSGAASADDPLMVAIREGPMLQDVIRQVPLAATLLWIFSFLSRPRGKASPA